MFDINQITSGIQLGFAANEETTQPLLTSVVDINELSNNEDDNVVCSDFYTRCVLSKPKTLVQHFNAIISAIEEIKSNNDTPDLDAVYSFTGFGPIREVFDTAKDNHAHRREQLSGLLTKEEYSLAREATLTSFYTSHCISNAFWDGIIKAGFSNGRICDPACGTGRLIAPIPTDIKSDSQITLVEYDGLTFKAAEALYPNATIHNEEFQDVKLPQQDIIVSNPPFNSALTSDRTGLNISGLTLHDLFVIKSLMSLRDQGFFFAVLPTSFLDSENNKVRKQAAQLANLVGGVRVPYELFGSDSATKTAVDVLLFQGTTTPDSDCNWIESEECQLDTLIYHVNTAVTSGFIKDLSQPTKGFLFNRESVLYGAIEPENLDNQVYDAVYSVASQANYVDFTHEDAVSQVTVDLANPETVQPFTYNVTTQGEIVFQNDRSFIKCDIPQGGMKYKRILGIIEIANVLTELMDQEASHVAIPAQLDSLRLKLNSLYDAYVAKYGFLSNRANTLAFKQDARIGIVVALEEDYEQGISKSRAKELGCDPIPDKADKATILTERAFTPWELPTSAKSPEDALALCLAFKGGIDFDLIASLLNTDVKTAQSQLLGKAVFFDPAAQEYLLKEVYLSGDVKQKLTEAQALEQIDPMMALNINALKQVIPADVPFSNIDAPMTAHWLPQALIVDFLVKTFGYNESQVKVSYSLGKWGVKVPTMSGNAKALVDFSCKTHSLAKIIDKIYSHGEKIVHTKDTNGNITGVDHKASASLAQAIKKIELKWKDFIAQSGNREQIEELYNEKINRSAPFSASFSGHFYFPDKNPNIDFYPHQNTAIRRGLMTRDHAFLLDIAMGGGKTMIIAAVYHEFVRLGLKNRCGIVVPNHLVNQTAAEWLRLYPNDRSEMLILNSESMSPKHRLDTLLRLKTGSYKFVIIPISTFRKIPAPIDAVKTVVSSRLSELEELKEKADSRHTVRDVENQKRILKEQLKAVTNAYKGEDFASLGFDSLSLDECQMVKNSGYATSHLRGVKGLGTTKASQTSIDVAFKVQYLIDTYANPGVMFCSGTPISNSLIECYGYLRMLAPRLLEAVGITCLDDWSTSFTRITQDYEVNADGTVKLTSRVKEFNNIKELQALYSVMAYTISHEQLKELIPKVKDGNGDLHPAIVPMNGDKPKTKISSITDETLDYMLSLAERSKDFESSPVLNDNALLIISDARKASVSPMMVNPYSDEVFSQKTKDMIISVAAKYHADTVDNSVQLCFVDIGTPDPKKDAEEAHVRALRARVDNGDKEAETELNRMRGVSVNLYRHIKQALVDLGVKEDEIAFVQDCKTDAQKQELFQLANVGRKRVILSTMEKLATGANLQERIAAVHCLCPPLRPSDLDQAVARAIRKGNKLYEKYLELCQAYSVDIIYYALDRSCDAWLYGILEAKSSTIREFRSGQLNARKITIDDDVMTYAEIKAAVTGNKALLEMLQVERELFEENILYRDFLDKTSYAERKIRNNNDTIKNLSLCRVDVNSDHEALIKSVQEGQLALTMLNHRFESLDQKVAEALYMHFSNFRKKCKNSGNEKELTLATLADFEIVARASTWGQLVFVRSTTTKRQFNIDKNLYTKGKLLPAIINRMKAFRQDIEALSNRIVDLENENNELAPVLAEEFDTSKLNRLEMRKIDLIAELADASNDDTNKPLEQVA
ncbi:DEAD/DEAH box helicase family protein [Vibrio vulnificus]|uniref:Helicase ATP-binding domain-containing protein n=1 Tax=Vibrio vulnificus TaxID=672 RepID=A0A2S3R2F4_VIBVL|nr:DEAD/DEAH box helicase family protein [Vibrio vulnificus]POB47281.1 hypothetical protein CRN52_14465 [Vibrio vulnificus]